MTKPFVKDFSIIVPIWRGALKFLPRLLDSIPKLEGIEIIIVDNSSNPIRSEEIVTSRDIILLHSAPDRHAGGSRNDGIAISKGKWLLFADADDFYAPDAFDIYYSMLNTDADMVYTGMGGIYDDTGEPSDRGSYYANLVHGYCMGEVSETALRVGFASPCCKMVKHSLVDCYNLQFDEIRAGNDVYFSLTTGYYASKIIAIDKITYIASINRGSLTQRRDYEVIRSRLYSKLRYNQFLRNNQLNEYQHSIMYFLYESRRYGLCKMWEFVNMCIKFKQNPFVGYRNWYKTILKVKENNKRNSRYITK